VLDLSSTFAFPLPKYIEYAYLCGACAQYCVELQYAPTAKPPIESRFG